jgi:hypothetical protein
MSTETLSGSFWAQVIRYEQLIQRLIGVGLVVFLLLYLYTLSFSDPPVVIKTNWFELPISNQPPITHVIGYIVTIPLIPFASSLFEVALDGFESWRDERFRDE